MSTTAFLIGLGVMFLSSIVAAVMFVHRRRIIRTFAVGVYFAFYAGGIFSSLRNGDTQWKLWQGVMALSLLIGAAVWGIHKLWGEFHSYDVLDEI